MNQGNAEGKKCPFCRDNFLSHESLHDHVRSVHSIDQEHLEKLQSMMKRRRWVVGEQRMDIEEKDQDSADTSIAAKGIKKLMITSIIILKSYIAFILYC